MIWIKKYNTIYYYFNTILNYIYIIEFVYFFYELNELNNIF